MSSSYDENFSIEILTFLLHSITMCPPIPVCPSPPLEEDREACTVRYIRGHAQWVCIMLGEGGMQRGVYRGVHRGVCIAYKWIYRGLHRSMYNVQGL